MMNIKNRKTENLLTTDDIFDKMYRGEPIPKEEVEFVSPEQLRIDLYNEFREQNFSINRISTECGIQPSHLSDFLNNKKKMSRDKLLSIFITLKYNIPRTNRQLLRFGYHELYSRNMRDFIILTGIRDQLSLDEINTNLEKERLKTLG